jgi:hypothetical protein
MYLLHKHIPRLSGVTINTHTILTKLAKFYSCNCIVFALHEKNFDVAGGGNPYRII